LPKNAVPEIRPDATLPVARHYDVVVIGGGVAGLSARRSLAALGVGSVALSHSTGTPCASRLAAGIIQGGQSDNFTRVSHAHGAEFAAGLWRLGDAAFDAVVSFCRDAGVPVATARRLRLVTSPAELTEAEKAVEQLAAAGLVGRLRRTDSGDPLIGEVTPRVLAVQDDGPRGGVVDAGRLLDALAAAAPSAELPPVEHIDTSASRLRLALADGTSVTCEVAVCAAHLGIGTLVPQLRAALVSVADQWSPVTLAADADARAWGTPGVVYSANHTYEWGAVTAPGRLVLGGGRYLRPWAGIEAETAVAEESITKHLLGQLAKTFAFGRGATPAGPAQALLDCRPCDELPIVGPMFGDGRVLVATGFMGTGLTLGFLAGQCLAELVANGRSDRLPRRLWPERLRTLEA
jgi:glycine/D-amino acid oxidase-like deaminating enzyme